MKRSTIASLGLALCFGGLTAPAAWANEVWVPVINGSQYGYLCEVYAPDRPVWGEGQCAKVTESLNPGVKPRRLKPGDWIRMDLTNTEVATIEQKLGITLSSSAPIVSDPPYQQRAGVANENLGSNSLAQIPPPPAPADPELLRRLDELKLLFTNQPPPPPATVDMTILYAGLGALGAGLLFLALLILGVRSQGKKHETNLKKYGDAFRVVPVESAEKQKAIQTLVAGILDDESALKRLGGELETARTTIGELTTRAETAEADYRREKAEAEQARAEAARTAEAAAAKEKERAAAAEALALAKADASTTAEELKRLTSDAETLRTESERAKATAKEAEARATREADEAATARTALTQANEAHRVALERIQGENERTARATDKALAATEA